jgi:group I intron endonuclease
MKAIYAIRHKDSGKSYVGSAVVLSRRWKYHKNRLRRNEHHSSYFQNAWNLYGEEAFEWVVLENLDEQCKSLSKEETLAVIEQRENYWVEHYREREGVYNLREVAQSNLGIKYSDESKKKMGEWQLGKKLSDETKQKISEAHQGKTSHMKGKTFSEEVRKKMSDSAKKKKLSPEHKSKIAESIKGRTFSAESLAKMSASQKGHGVSEETKRKISEAQKIRLAKRKADALQKQQSNDT